MDFGVCVLAKPQTCAQQAKLAEEHGFSHVWVSDTQMMAGDPYVCLALIAQQTTQLKLGTGVSVAGDADSARHCELHRYAELTGFGRIILGIGTGKAPWRAMGMPPRSLRELREHVRHSRASRGQEVEHQHEESGVRCGSFTKSTVS
jgi:alkanesulfonate monooxygenase SsuD/methylene tetrahydromethanopterin reductase-like flavin-dependent oxidoreductase (luciferase family)